MASLSPKARRFIALAIESVDDPNAKAIWRAVDRDVGGPLPDAAARVALTALQQFERRLRARLESPSDEDEASDLSNDLGLVFAIESDLIKQLGGRAALGPVDQ